MTTTPPTPEITLIVEGVRALTGDPARPHLPEASVLVAGDRIVEIREGCREAEAWPAATRIDGRGRVLTPGLVNVHTHAILSMVRGVAEDMGFAPAYTPGVPHGHDVREDEAVALARLGAVEALCFGSTLINDTFVHQHLTLPAMAETGLRAWGCGRIHDVDFSRVHLGEWTHEPAIGETTLGEAIDLHERFHGRADGRMGVQLSPHAPDTCSRPLLERIAAVAAERDMRVNTHLSQSRVEVDRIREREGMSPPALLDEIGLLNDRLIAAHCIHVDADDIARIGRAGIHVAHIAKGNQTHGHTAPTQALRAAGARLALGTDNMHADMVEVMRWALATGRLQRGRVDDDWQPETVFSMATGGGATAMGLDDEIGRIAPGMKADFVLFDFTRLHLTPVIDALGNLVHTAQGRDVETVVVDGRIVVDKGEPLLIDRATVVADAQAAAQSLWDRAKRDAA